MPPFGLWGQMEAILFDLDGTLINSVDSYRRVLNLVFGRMGLPPVSREKVVAAMTQIRFSWDNVLPDELPGPKEEIVAQAQKLVMEVYPDAFRREVRLFPGAAEVLSELDARGFKLGVVTSTHRKFMGHKMYPLQAAGRDVLFKAVVTIEDAPRVKPAPDPLVECALRLEANQARCVYVGDSLVDVQAGRAAGMKTVAVLSGVGDFQTLSREGPDRIVETVAELCSERNLMDACPAKDEPVGK